MNYLIKISTYIIILFLVLLLSCIRDVTVELPRPDEKMIVDAYIEIDSTAVVFLTKNYSYFDAVTDDILDSRIIWGDDAVVTISYGNISEVLKPTHFERYPHKGYAGSIIKGKINGIYELNIEYDGKNYSAITSIPDSIGIDSVWFQSWFIDENDDYFGPLGINWLDPPGLGNYYMITLRVEGSQKSFYRPIFSIGLFDDKLDDGKTMMYYPIFRSYDGNDYYQQERDTSLDNTHYFFYKVGDTVSIKLSTMDTNSFRFWNSLSRNIVTSGNPFANPTTIISNIEGKNAGGYWAGYGSYIKTVYIKDSVTLVNVDL